MTDATCSVEDCEREKKSRGWCSMHYARWVRTGKLSTSRVRLSGGALPPSVCVVTECNEPVFVGARGWCNAHYHRWQRYGDPLGEAPLKGEPSPKRKWMGAHGLTGYDYHGCRCEVCSAAKTESNRVLKERLRGDARTPHGTVRGYQGWCCRCDACSDAMREAQQQPEVAARRAEVAKRSRQRLQGVEPPVHGVSGYSNRGCRCEVCTEAAKVQGYQRVERDREAVPHPSRSVERDLWTGPELELVLTRRDLDDRQIARMLGRTVKAVRTARYRSTHDPKWMRVAGIESS